MCINGGCARLCRSVRSTLGSGRLATEPCGDFGECRVIVEINATDGDVGFQWLADGDELRATEIVDPKGRRVFANAAFGPLRDQTLTESFGESAEPVCRAWLAEDPDDDVLTVAQFVRRWPAGNYKFHGTTADGTTVHGQSALTHWLPAAPTNVQYSRGVISWEPGWRSATTTTRLSRNWWVSA